MLIKISKQFIFDILEAYTKFDQLRNEYKLFIVKSLWNKNLYKLCKSWFLKLTILRTQVMNQQGCC